MSIKKQEINQIVEHFNIQPENPLCFLNQETSKKLLSTNKPTDLYNLFLQSTQLESMAQIQKKIEAETTNAEIVISEKEALLPRLEEQIYIWQDKYRKSQKNFHLSERYQELMLKSEYAYIKEQTQRIELLRGELATMVTTNSKRKAEFDAEKEKFTKIDDRYSRLRSSISQRNKEVEVLSTEQKEIKEAHAKAREAKTNNVRKIDEITRCIERKIKLKQKISESMQVDRSAELHEYQKTKFQKESELTSLKKELDELIQFEREKKEVLNTNSIKRGELKLKVEATYSKRTEIKQKKAELDRNIRALEKSRENQIELLGDFMPRLLDRIRQYFKEGLFSRMPKGPIGLLVKPKAQIWALAIEQALSSLMTSFICSNYTDERLMHQVFNECIPQVYQRPRVIVTDFNTAAYDIHKNVTEINLCIYIILSSLIFNFFEETCCERSPNCLRDA
jgi:chromosome segregation ATPase